MTKTIVVAEDQVCHPELMMEDFLHEGLGALLRQLGCEVKEMNTEPLLSEELIPLRRR